MKFFLGGTLFCIRNIFDSLCNFRERSILCYYLLSHDTAQTSITPERFDKHLRALKRAGYSFVSLGDVVAWYDGANILPNKAIAVTFDDEYADFKTAALPILEKYNVPAFCSGRQRRLSQIAPYGPHAY